MNKEGYTKDEIIRKLELEISDLKDMVKFHQLEAKKWLKALIQTDSELYDLKKEGRIQKI